MLLKLCSTTALTLAILAMPRMASADLLLDTDSATQGATSRGPGTDGLGQGVSVSTTTDLTQFAMFLESPNGGTIKYMIWNADNTALLLSDVVSVPTSITPEWVLSDPLSFSLASGSTYYFGAIQDANTALVVPFFNPAFGVTQNGLSALDTGNSNYEDFLSPGFTSIAGASLPLRLFGTQGSVGPSVPEPSMLLVLVGGLLVVVGRARRSSSQAMMS
jgi:hypothetical protein